MSRSYRKPWITDGYKGSKTKQYRKNQANRRTGEQRMFPMGKLIEDFMTRGISVIINGKLM